MATMTLTQIARGLMINLNRNIPTLITGPIGVGKTDVVRQCAAKLRAQGKKVLVIDRRASQMEPTDIAVPMPDVATRTVIMCLQEWLPDAATAAQYDLIIILLDELSDAQPATLAALNQLILERTVGSYTLSANVRLVGTGNRQADRGNAQRFNRATSNRFSVFEAGIDIASLVAWLNDQGMTELSAYVQGTAREFVANGKPESDAIHQYPVAGSDAVAFLTPRSLARCNEYLQAGLNDVDLRMMVASSIGDDAAAMLMQFLATYRLLPDLLTILNDPMNAPIHRESSTNYALVVALTSKLTLATIGNISTYIKRLSPAYQAAFWSNAIAKDVDPATGKSLYAETPQFVEYKIST